MDLATYLEGLPGPKLEQLYDSPWTCRAVLRALPPLGQLYAMRLLLPQSPVSQGLVAAWSSVKGRTKHNAAVAQLLRLRLLQEAAAGSSQPGWRLHPSFRRQLLAAISGSGTQPQEPVPADVTAAAPSAADLECFAESQWEGLLLYLGGWQPRPPGKPAALVSANIAGQLLDVDDLLQGADLLTTNARGERQVTQTGYNFLLREAYGQLWTLLRQYVKTQEAHSGAELASAISFLLQLGFQPPGRPLLIETLTAEERRIAADLSQLGLLCPFRVGSDVWLSPTQLALALAGSGGSGGTAGTGSNVIVETNYRVYAYTDSTLQKALLQLFVRCECILPNLFVGTITRESMVSALGNGLRAEALIGYLRQHAHPKVLSRKTIVPEVVSDQIRLWQADTTRVRAIPATLYSAFETPGLWRGTVQKAQELGSHLWDMPPRKAGPDDAGAFTGALVSQAGAHSEIRDKIKVLKASGI